MKWGGAACLATTIVVGQLWVVGQMTTESRQHLLAKGLEMTTALVVVPERLGAIALVVVVVATQAVVAATSAEAATLLVVVVAATSAVLAVKVGLPAVSSGMVVGSVSKTVACQVGVAMRAVQVARSARLVEL